jgi:hypothetical protein
LPPQTGRRKRPSGRSRLQSLKSFFHFADNSRNAREFVIPWLPTSTAAVRVGFYGGRSVTSATRRRASQAGPGVPRKRLCLSTNLYAVSASWPYGKSGNRNGYSEMAGPIAWPKMPRKILSFWICGCTRSDTMDNETAWQGLSKRKEDKGSRQPPQPGPFDFSKSFVSLLPSRIYNPGYRVSCLSHESCKRGQDSPLVGNGTTARLDGAGWHSERNRVAARSDQLGGGGWRRARVRDGRRRLICRRYCAGDSLRFAR